MVRLSTMLTEAPLCAQGAPASFPGGPLHAHIGLRTPGHGSMKRSSVRHDSDTGGPSCAGSTGQLSRRATARPHLFTHPRACGAEAIQQEAQLR